MYYSVLNLLTTNRSPHCCDISVNILPCWSALLISCFLQIIQPESSSKTSLTSLSSVIGVGLDLEPQTELSEGKVPVWTY